ncbi:MAG: hypothetical protein ABW321_13350 [Polyangiales bacterium]
MRQRTSTSKHPTHRAGSRGRGFWLAAGVLAAGSALTACGDSEEGTTSTGTLVIPFQLGNNRACEDLGVEMVRAELTLNDKEYVEDAPCGQFQVRFRDIAAGTYELTMVGVDEDGVEIMDSYTERDTMVSVAGNDQTSVTMPVVTLTAAPAHLLVRWNFGFTNCRAMEIESFVVAAWRGSGTDKLIGDTLDCEGEPDRPDQYREIPDPDRRFTGEGTIEVSVQPLDAMDVNVGNAVTFKFMGPGPGREARLSLDCDIGGGCDGTGKLDRN